MARNLGYKAMGKLLGLKEPRYRHIEFGFDKPDQNLKYKMTELWEKWLESPKSNYELSDFHSEKQKDILKELGLGKLIR